MELLISEQSALRLLGLASLQFLMLTNSLLVGLVLALRRLRPAAAEAHVGKEVLGHVDAFSDIALFHL